jgi:iron complex transport system substrate-binding protein
MKSYKLYLAAFVLLGILAGGLFLHTKTGGDNFDMPDFEDATQEDYEAPGRIISLLPSNTEILFELGVKDIVGISNFCNWPAETKNIRKLGDSFTADIEAILELNPGVVYIGQNAAVLEERLDELDIPNAVIPDAQNVKDIFFNIDLIAMYQGADSLPITDELQVYVKEKPAAKFKVFVEVDDGLWTVGGQSFINDLLEYAGAENIFKDSPAGYFQTSAEAVLKAGPDIIISLKPAKKGGFLPKGLKEKKVIRLDPDIYTRPTPRAIRGIPDLAAKLNEAR